jgi:hypothetical protein
MPPAGERHSGEQFSDPEVLTSSLTDTLNFFLMKNWTSRKLSAASRLFRRGVYAFQARLLLSKQSHRGK